MEHKLWCDGCMAWVSAFNIPELQTNPIYTVCAHCGTGVMISVADVHEMGMPRGERIRLAKLIWGL